MHDFPARCLSTDIRRSPPNSGSLLYVLKYPSRQRGSKCVLAQGVLSMYHDQGRPTALNYILISTKYCYIAELVQLPVLTAHYGSHHTKPVCMGIF
jgi:hypothetical protein